MKYRILVIFILASLGSIAQTGCSSTKINFNTGSYYYPQCFLDSIYIDKVTANQYLYVNSQKKVVSVPLSSLTPTLWEVTHRGDSTNETIKAGGFQFRTTGSGFADGSSSTAKTWTFPNTTGTVALTSNLSSYLPLAGGTMAGNIVMGSPTYILYSSGNATLNDIYAYGYVGATTLFEINGKSRIYSAADGRFNLTNNAATTFTRLAFGLENTSHPSLQVNGKKLVTMLGDGSATSNFQVKDTVFSSVWNGQIDVPTKNAVYDQMILKVNYTDTAAMLSKYLRKTDTTAMLSPYVLESKVYSGTYSPTASDLQNVTSVSFTNCGTRYMRINSQVTVYGAASVVITSSTTQANFEVTLPIASTLTTGNFTDIAGVVTGVDCNLAGNVLAENNHAQISWGATGMVAGTYNINYTYSYTIN